MQKKYIVAILHIMIPTICMRYCAGFAGEIIEDDALTNQHPVSNQLDRRARGQTRTTDCKYPISDGCEQRVRGGM